jgi:(2Fe-2S) ferredoxin
LGVKPDEVESVVTFYSMYSDEPRGRYVLKVCTSIACYLRGCDALFERLESRLGVTRGGTTPDGRFTLETIECLAACGGAPVAQVNGEFVEQVTPERADELVDRLVRGEGIADLAARWRATDNGGFVAVPAAAGKANASSTASAANASGTGVHLEIAPSDEGSAPNGKAANGKAANGKAANGKGVASSAKANKTASNNKGNSA